MEIIKIMNAVLAPCQTDGEYQWAESSECAYGRSWEGDVRGYLENALLEGHDPEEVAAMMSGDYEGSIHDLPEGASVLVGAMASPRPSIGRRSSRKKSASGRRRKGARWRSKMIRQTGPRAKIKKMPCPGGNPGQGGTGKS